MTAEEDRARAVMLLDSGQAAEAAELLGLALASEPEDGTLWCLQGRALLALNRYSDAMASAKRASELLPRAAEPHLIASTILGRVDDREGSARAAREAVSLAPTDPRAWERVCYAVGDLLDWLGSSGDRAVLGRIRELSDEVLSAADRVVALAPTESDAYLARGYALRCARRPDQAQDAYRRAQAIAPTGPPAGPPAAVPPAGPGAAVPSAGPAPPGPASEAYEVPVGSERRSSLDVWTRRVAVLLVIVLVLGVASALLGL